MVAGNSFPFSGIEAFVEIDDDGGLFCGAAARRLDPSLCTGTVDRFTLSIDNPCFQLPVGRVWRLWGEENDEELVVEIEVLDETQLIGDVETRVVLERE